MRTQLDYIIDDLKECFDGRPWYGDSVMKKLDSIDWRIINGADYGDKSIAVLVQHIMNWRIFALKKLAGDADYDIIIDGPTDWTPITIENEAQWVKLKQDLRQTQKELLAALTVSDDSLLRKEVPGKTYTFGPILKSIIQHDIYHLGQIAMLNAKGA